MGTIMPTMPDITTRESRAKLWRLIFSYQEEVEGYDCWKLNTPQYIKDWANILTQLNNI
jgi:hypothetical protein